MSLTYGAEIQAFVLMPNHFHLIITVPEPELDLGKVMSSFLSKVTKFTNHATGRSGHLFGGPHHRTLIKSTRYYRHALKYVYRNPVKAKLCEWVEDWPYSTLHGLIGRSRLPFPIYLTRAGMEIMLPAQDPIDQLEWLNTPFPSEAEQLIQKGLRKKVFEAFKDAQQRKYLPLESLL